MVPSLVVVLLLASLPPHFDTTSLSAGPSIQDVPGDSLPETSAGERAHGIAYERASDAIRYDRVQGLSLGLGYRARLAADAAQADGYGTARYGISDQRFAGRLSVVRDAPTLRLAVSGYRDVVNVDPIAVGQTVGNSINALFVAHDDADYALATGGSVSLEIPLRAGLELRVSGRVERQEPVAREARSAINDFLGGDGEFPPNGPLDRGTFGGGRATLAGTGNLRWTVTVDGLAGTGTTTARVYGTVRPAIGDRAGITLSAKAGIATSPTLQQMQFRVGGLQTVRGFDYGTLRGQAFWAAQLDAAPIPGRIRPVLFIDAGQAGAAGDLFDTQALVGGGVGLSVFGGIVRLDLSRRLSPSAARLRFDVVVGAAR